MCTATQLVVIKTSEISRWKSMLRLFSKWPVFIRELTFFQGEIQIANEHMKRCSAALVMELKVTQSCLTLCDPMDFTVHGILQARILKWAAFPFSRGIFPTQGLNPGLSLCRWILYHLSYEGSPHWLWGKFKSKPHGKPFPTHKEGYNQEVKQRQALVRMCRNPNPYTRILKHCWWGWELVWPLWKTAWQVLKWLNQELR